MPHERQRGAPRRRTQEELEEALRRRNLAPPALDPNEEFRLQDPDLLNEPLAPVDPDLDERARVRRIIMEKLRGF